MKSISLHIVKPMRVFLSMILLAVVTATPVHAEGFTARYIGDHGNVTVMEVSGDFNSNKLDGRLNVEPRQIIAREFLRLHKDEYDFVAIFTNFDYERPPEAAAYYTTVKNDVQGVGQEIFDNSSLYGSNGKLQGTIDMWNLLKLATNPLDPKFDFTIDTLVHETLHRWGAFVKFRDWNGVTSDAILGYQKDHWSFLFDSGGSTHLGNKWQNNGDGTFTSTAVRKYYSPLDLYLMGMIDKSKVPPTLLIDNPAIDPAKLSELGVTISGTARYVSIDDIIAVEGERIPNAGDSQKQFKTAFIYAVSPGTFKSDDLYGIENLRNAYLTRFSILTDGKGLVQVASTPKDNLAVNPGVRPPSSIPRILPPNIDNGVSWLMNRQQTDGSWTDFALTTERDTAETVTTLQHFPIAAQSLQAGSAWLGNNAYANTDFLARRIEAAVQTGNDSSALLQELLARRNSDGGWGGNRNFTSTSTDTALALKALAVAGYSDSTVTGPAIVYLQGSQNADGGWSGDDAFSAIQPTAAVLSVFNSYRKNTALDTNQNKAVAFLASKQNPDGGFGNSPSTVYDSALAVMALQGADADRAAIGRGVGYLLGQQSDNGAWFDSPFQTALAVRAVWTATVDPDLSIKPEDISSIPATVTALPTNVVLNATVWNLGRKDVPQAKVAVYDGVVTSEKKVAEQIAAFPGQSPVTLTFPIPVTDGKGHVFHIVADPDNQLVESNRNNNSAIKPLLPEITYDFQVLASDIGVTPNPVDVFQDVKIAVKVTNRGTSDAFNVPVRLFIDRPSAPMEIAQVTVDIPGGGSATREVTWRAGLAGVNMPLTVQIDPNNSFGETSKDNNKASVPLTVNTSTLPNLSVSYRDMVITPIPAREGGSASISILVKNDGFLTAENVKVNVFKGVASNNGTLLGSQIIPSIPAGQSVQVSMEWNGIAENGERIISVQVDPDNVVQEITRDDNFAFSTLRILGLPDVAVSSDSMSIAPSAPREGESVIVTITVRNLGDQDAANVDLLLMEGDTVIGRQTIPVLAGNSQVNLNMPFAPLGSGVHQLTAIADPGNSIIERDKQNNVANKTFSAQNARFWLSERYISPNGDGIKDSTTFSFRLDAPATVSVEIMDSEGQLVRAYSGGDLINTMGTTVSWDGKYGSENIVKDGTYGIVVYGESRRILARESVVVDTNRLPLSASLAANSLLERNISCQFPLDRSTISWLPDESGLLVHLNETVPPTPEYPAGIYLLSPTGDTASQVLPDRWSDDLYTYSLDTDSVKLAPDGKTLAVIAWRKDRTTGREVCGIWSSDLSGGSRRLLHLESEGGLTIYDIEWSPDNNKILFNYGPVYRAGGSRYELAYIDVEQGSKRTIVYGYPLSYSGLYSTAWSPDSTRIAFIQNLFCNPDYTSCNQDYERLMVYDLNGTTSTWKINGSSWYSLDLISWIDNRSLFYDYYGNGDITLIREGVATPIVTGAKEYALSPLGDKVAFIDGANLKVVDAQGTVATIHVIAKPALSQATVVIKDLLWSPDGERIAFVEGLDGLYCMYYGKSCPEAYGPVLMTVDVITGSKKSIPLGWPWKGGGALDLYLLDWLDNGNVVLAHDATYGNGNPLVAINRQSASSFQLVQGVSLPGEEGLLLSPNKNYLTYDNWGVTRAADGACRSSLWSSTSVANLSADLQAVKGKQSVTLRGIATDLNFESYSIEYASSDAPDIWNPIIYLSTKPVINDTFTAWLPPSIGAYLVRLTVRDMAGNATSRTIRFAWGTSLPLNSVLKSTEIISPNGDGIRDSITLEYSVSEPMHLDFAISNESGTVVRTISVDHPAPQRSSIVWDGRDEAGILAPDGMYRIAVLDYSFSVEVDSAPPLSSITMGAIRSKAKEVGYQVELTGRATDKNLISWAVEYGMGDNPQEWLPVSSGNTNLVKRDEAGDPVDPEADVLIYSYNNSDISSLKGKKFRITVEDRAGNRSTAISNFVEEKAIILTWDGQATAGAILPAKAAAGKHDVTGFETLRLPATNQRMQYWTNGIWHDAEDEPPGAEGSIAYTWNSSGLQMGNAYKVRMVAVDQGGRSFTSNELATQTVFSLGAVCPSGLFADIALFEEIRSLTLVVQSDQDVRYKEWNTYHRRDLSAGQPSFTGSLPVPEVGAGMQYQIKMTVIGASGKIYELQTPYPPSCPVNIELSITYDEAQGCGQASNGMVTLKTDQKGSYGQAQFLKTDYYLFSPSGRKLLQSVDMVREGWRQTLLDTSAMIEGEYQVQAVVGYYDRNDGKNKEALATSKVLVDRALPTAGLTYPSGSGTTVCPVKVPISGGSRYGIPLEGIANDAGGVKRYELFFGSGSNPADWQQAFAAQASSQSPIGFKTVPIEGSGAKTGQFGIWDVNDLSGTNYTIRLRVIDTVGNASCTSAGVNFDKVIQVVSLSTDKTVISASGRPGADLTASYRIDENANVQPSVYRLIERKDLPPLLDVSPIRTIGSTTPYLSGIGTSSWNGLTDAGVVAPDGRYAFVVSATDACGNTGSKWAQVEVDTSPPVVSITYPSAALPLLPTMLVDIKGTVTDPHLNSYTLEAGEGDAPATWHIVSTGNREVRDASLGGWNTYGLSGRWSLRLTASDTAGNSIQQTVGVELGNRNSLIKYLNLTPRLFSPNGDQRLETISIAYEVTDAVLAKIEIVDASGAVIREFVRTDSTGVYFIVWDGRNSFGAVAADGVYTVRLTASLNANPSITQTETVSLTVDGKPPVVDIAKPADSACLNTSALAVSGSVTDQNIQDYFVTFAGPAGVIAEEQGNQNRQNYTLFTLADMAEDVYSLTVEANDLGENHTKLVRTFTIDRTSPKVTLDTPGNGDFFGNARNVIDLSGAIVEKNLERYSLRYGSGDAPADWQEVVGGNIIPSIAKLASLKAGTSDGITDGVYTISLYAKDKAGLEGEARARIVIDNTLPEASVTNPKDGDYVSKSFDIKGTVADSYLDKGALELGEGPCSTVANWAAIKTISATVRDGILDSWKLLPVDGEYCIRLTAADKSGNKSEAKTGFKIDTHPPASPELIGKTENKTVNSLSWTKSPGTDVAGYNVYRNGQKLNVAPITDLAFSDSGLKDGSYLYNVKALDLAGNESAPSNGVTLKIDLNGPSVRISTPGNGTAVSSLIDIKGTAYSQDDFKEYRVYIGQGSSPSAWTLVRRSPLPTSFGSLAQWDTSTSPDGAQFIIKLEGEDLSGNISATQSAITIDTAPPMVPLLLAAVPSNADVALSWKANNDADLAGYLLYRNDQLANVNGIIAGNLKPYLVIGTGYTDRALADGAYRYYLAAMDQAGNSSDQSNTLDVTIDTHPPHMTIPEPQNGRKFESQIMIKAETPDNDIATAQFQYKRVQDQNWVNLGAPLVKPPFISYLDPKSLSFVYGDYQLRVLAVDRGGKSDPAPTIVTATYTDLTPPVVPFSLAARVNGAEVNLAWSGGTETDLDGYNVYRWNNLVKTKLNGSTIKAPSYLDGGVPDGNYNYEITAIDIYGNESKPSGQSAARIFAPLIAQPYTPLKNSALMLGGSGVTPDSPVEIATVQPSGTTVRTTVMADLAGSFRLEGITLQLGENRFTAVASDSAGNVSRASDTAVVVYDEPPATPTGLAASVSGYDVSLTWNANSESDIIGYNLYRDGEKVNNNVAITGGQASASYQNYYSMPQNAIDGNYGTYWGTAYGNGTFTPAWWQMSLSAPELISRVDITWQLADWDSANKRYNIFAGKDYEVQAWSGYNWITLKKVVGNDQRNNTIDFSPPYRTDRIRIAIATTTDPSSSKYVRIDEIRFTRENPIPTPDYTDMGLLDHRYSYKVSAVDGYGFESTLSTPITAVVGDVEPPGPPTSLVATAQGSDVVLSWSLPTQVTGDLAQYYIYRETPTGWVHIGSSLSSVLIYTDHYLTNSTYRYRVTAVDLPGNESSSSNEAEVMVSIEPPQPPLMLSISSPSTGGSLDLSWQAPSETGQYSYNVYRSQNETGPFSCVTTSAVTGNRLRDNGLVNGTTYYYRIKALDATGNESEPGNIVSGVPQDIITLQPTIFRPTVPGMPLVVKENGVTVGGFAEPAAQVEIMRDGVPLGSSAVSLQDVRSDWPVALNTDVASLSPDGQVLAYVDYSGQLKLRNQNSGETVSVSPAGFSSFSSNTLQWSPDGRYLLVSVYDYSWRGKIALYDRNLTKIRLLTTGVTLSEWDASWSPGGDVIVFAGQSTGGAAGIWRARTDNTVAVLLAGDVYAGYPKLSPDGDYIAFFEDSNLNLFSTADDSISLLDDNTDGQTTAWSPDGSKLAHVSYRDGGDGEFYVFSMADGISTRLTYSAPNGYNAVWAPDSSQLAYAAWSDAGEVVRIVQSDGGEREMPPSQDDMFGMEWRRDGALLFIDNTGIHSIIPAGTFSLSEVQLAPGENRIVAVATDTSGNQSTPSEPITVVLDTGMMPDLIIVDGDITIFPPYTKPGEEVLVTARVRNPTNNPAENVTVDLYQWDGAGEVALLKTETIPHLNANSEGSVSISFNVGSSIGIRSVIAVADPSNLIQEVMETNNYAAQDIVVTDQERVQLTTALNSLQYASNQEISAGISLRNSGLSKNGFLSVTVEDGAGTVVKQLAGQSRELPYGLNESLSFSWNTGTTYAGNYRFHAVVKDGSIVLAEDSTSFTILPDLKVSAGIATDRHQYGPSQDVRISVNFTNVASNNLIPQLRANVSLFDPQNTRMFSGEEFSSNLTPGMSGALDFAWNTGLNPPGVYVAKVDYYVGDLLVDNASVDFTVIPSVAVGGVVKIESNVVLIGGALTAEYTISNSGNTNAAGQVIVSLVDPDTFSVVLSSEQAVTIPMGGSQSGIVLFTSSNLQLKPYLIKLHYVSQGSRTFIGSVPVSVCDGTPPVLTVISPREGERYDGDVSFSITVSDDASGVARVEYALDGGAWNLLSPTNSSVGRYGFAWKPFVSENGPHAVHFRATDRAGNVSSPLNVSFVVLIDITPPTGSILINSGAGIIASTLVTLNLTAADTNGIAQMQLSNDNIAWTDPEPFAGQRSWYLLPGDGPKQVYIRYKDTVGNWSVDPITAAIVLDTTPPVVSASPAGGIYKAAQSVQLTVNEAATIYCTTDGSTPTTSSPVYGGPLAIAASTTLNCLAMDSAGNPGRHSENYIIDTIPPVLIVSALPDGSYTNNEVLNISGTVTDNVGVKELLINNVSVPFGSDGKFSQALLLKSGENRIEVKTTDLATNLTEDTRTISLDQKAPLLVVTSPADNSMTNQPLVDVTGYVDETSTVEVSLKGVLQPVTMDGDTFTSTVALLPGADPNTVSITAIDLAMNPSSDKRSIYYDDQTPSLAITEPGQDIRTNQANLTIQGAASDPYGFGVTIGIEMDGQKFAPPVIDGKFEQAVTFATEGTYHIVATARNEAGTSTSVPRNIIYDITPPPLTIDPVSSPTVLPVQLISGTREADILVAVTCPTAIVGVVEYPTDTTWRATLSGMVVGDNIITVQAMDAAGNPTSVYSRITLLMADSDVAFTVAPNIIWPPNHKMVPVTIGGKLNIPTADVLSVDITLADEYGKYNYKNLEFGSVVKVEAWRNGKDMDGRFYTVTAVVTRRDGSKTTTTTTALVPHDMRDDKGCSDKNDDHRHDNDRHEEKDRDDRRHD